MSVDYASRQRAGLRLRYLRRRIGMSQLALAMAASTADRHLGAVERGSRTLTPALAARLAPFLGVEPGVLTDDHD